MSLRAIKAIEAKKEIKVIITQLPLLPQLLF